jgi:hypothetical protein
MNPPIVSKSPQIKVKSPLRVERSVLKNAWTTAKTDSNKPYWVSQCLKDTRHCNALERYSLSHRRSLPWLMKCVDDRDHDYIVSFTMYCLLSLSLYIPVRIELRKDVVFSACLMIPLNPDCQLWLISHFKPDRQQGIRGHKEWKIRCVLLVSRSWKVDYGDNPKDEEEEGEA